MDMRRLFLRLQKDEGVRKKGDRHIPYPDPLNPDIITIGYGRNLTANGLRDVEADYMLAEDIRECIHQLQSRYPWFNSLDSVRQEVLVNMCFNLGITTLSTFRMLSDVARGDYASAAERMRGYLWYRQVGRRGVRLANEMETGRAST